MATLREIRRRIAGIKNTQKITKAMKMVAAAKLRRAQDSILSTRPYARKLNELLRHLVRQVDPSVNPLFVPREKKKIALIVVTADRGMCGAFNANIIKHSLQFIQEDLKEFTESGNLQLFLIGKKGFDFFNKQKYPIFSFTPGIFGSLDFDSSKKVVSEIIKGYLEEKFDAVYVIYNEFKSIIQQRVIVEQFLPIPPEDITGIDHLKAIAQVEYIYEPSEKELMDELVQRHLNFQMWRILLESNAAEQGARMTAMDNATTNANELIQELTLSYNKARQAAITKELLEVVAGAEALKETG